MFGVEGRVFGVQGFREEDSGFRGLGVAGCRVLRFRIEFSEIRGFRDERVGFSDWRWSDKSFREIGVRFQGMLFRRVGAGLAVQMVRFMIFEFKGLELWVQGVGRALLEHGID